MARPETDPDARTDEESQPDFVQRIRFRDGAVAGAIATIAMGLVITATDAELLRAAIAGLYGQQGSLVVAWLAHVLHGSLFGLLFAVVLSDPSLEPMRRQPAKTVVAGVVYGLVLTVIGAGIIMPIWLRLVRFPRALPIPNVTTASLIWHLVYGVVLGGVFSVLSD